MTIKTGPVSRAERLEYYEYRAAHHEDGARRLPPEPVARRIWELVAKPLGLTIDDLLPKKTFQDRDVLAFQAMQALTVVLDTVVTDRTLAHNDIFDALASRFSTRFYAARGGAAVARDMTIETVSESLHEFRVMELEFEKILRAVQKTVPGLYRVIRPGEKYMVVGRDGIEREKTARTYKVRVDSPSVTFERVPELRWRIEGGSKVWEEFTRILNADRTRRTSKYHPLLFADEPKPEPRGKFEVAAEWQHNVVSPGPRTLEAMRITTGSVVHLVVDAITEDVEQMHETDDEEQNAKLAGLQAVRTAVIAAMPRRLDERGHLSIRTGYEQAINGRIEPTHFSPLRAINSDKSREYIESDVWLDTSSRDRWFMVDKANEAGARVRFTGLDTVSSQWQILAVLLGLTTLEQKLRERSIKELLADRALEKHREPGAFKLPDPQRFDRDDGYELLLDAMKFAATPLGYGSEFSEVAYRLRNDKDSPVGRHAPERARSVRGLGDHKNLEQLFLDEELGLRGIFERYLPTCKRLAATACARDPYAGFTFPSPLDPETRVRWNPIKRWGPDKSWKETSRLRRQMDDATDPESIARLAAKIAKREAKTRQHEKDRPGVKSGSIRIDVDLPIGEPNENGDYPVDVDALADMVAPCLIHYLDFALNGITIERLNIQGVPNFSPAHDAWLVPQDAMYPVGFLRSALGGAGKAWLALLGPIYDRLIEYAEDPKYGNADDARWLRELRETWRRRLGWAQAGYEEAWPQFQFKRSGTVVKTMSPDGQRFEFNPDEYETYAGQKLELGTYLEEKKG